MARRVRLAVVPAAQTTNQVLGSDIALLLPSAPPAKLTPPDPLLPLKRKRARGVRLG